MVDSAPDPDELADWLTLVSTPGVGPATCRTLLQAFGLPGEVLATRRDRLLNVVPARVADALGARRSPALDALIERTQGWSREPDNRVLTLADPRYPRGLLEMPDPPPVLYVKGDLERLNGSALAIVGSRNATPQGLVDAHRFAEALARAGRTIVSGLALGIDGAAHEGALAAGPAGGSTVAVVGTGLDIVYPAAHRALARRIANAGALVSEFPLGTGAAAHRFPQRNRLIAGLSRGVLVVEAAPQSGSLITARLAAENGRDVFAIPGSIHSPLSKGCHRLIRDGAKLVESVDDILSELGGFVDPASRAPSMADEAEPADDADAHLVDQIGFDPIAVDDLVERSGWPVQRLAPKLLELELAGRISRLPGGRVQRLSG